MDNSAIDVEIGERVHQLLWRQRVSQREFARALGVDPAAAARRLRGKTAWRVSDLIVVADLLGADAAALFAESLAASQKAASEFRCTPAYSQPRTPRRVPLTVISGEAPKCDPSTAWAAG